jgi:hypothetical protein
MITRSFLRRSNAASDFEPADTSAGSIVSGHRNFEPGLYKRALGAALGPLLSGQILLDRGDARAVVTEERGPGYRAQMRKKRIIWRRSGQHLTQPIR